MLGVLMRRRRVEGTGLGWRPGATPGASPGAKAENYGEEPARSPAGNQPGSPGPGGEQVDESGVFHRTCGRACAQCRRAVVSVLGIATESLCITMHRDAAHLRERDVGNHPPLWMNASASAAGR